MKLGTWRAGGETRAPACTHADGELTAANFVGASRRDEMAPSLVLWNCSCGSTLAVEVQAVLHDNGGIR